VSSNLASLENSDRIPDEFDDILANVDKKQRVLKASSTQQNKDKQKVNKVNEALPVVPITPHRPSQSDKSSVSSNTTNTNNHINDDSNANSNFNIDTTPANDQHELLTKLGLAPISNDALYGNVTTKTTNKTNSNTITASSTIISTETPSSDSIPATFLTTEAKEEDEWSTANALREKQLKIEKEKAATAGTISLPTASTNITYDVALQSILGISNNTIVNTDSKEEWQIYLPKIQRYDFRNISMFSSIKYSIQGPPQFRLDFLNIQRDRSLSLALMPLDLSRLDHQRVMYTIYSLLTEEDAIKVQTLPLIGQHWTTIGFQGNDPSTDLRGAGMLSMLQLLWALQNYRDIIRRIYLLSLDDKQNFPFCVVATNITAIVLTAIRQMYKIYGTVSREKNFNRVINYLFIAAFVKFYDLWKDGNCTIMDFQSIKETIEFSTLKKPKNLIKEFKSQVSRTRSVSIMSEDGSGKDNIAYSTF
jgi:hypothetical protein